MFKETYRRLNDIIQPDKALVAAVLAGGQRRKRGAKQPFVRIKPALIAAAICLCLVLTVPVLAASVEPVYELMYLVSPSVAQFFVPVQKSDTNNGIKMEVVSADIRGDTARIYITMQDLIGDRVDETIDLYDSYDIRLPFDGTGFCGKVGYDPNTRTATFLITIKTDGQKIAGKKITFSVGMFLSDKHVYDDIQIPVDLCTVSQNPKTQTVEVFGGGGEAAVRDLQMRLKRKGVHLPYKVLVMRDGEDRGLALLSKYRIADNRSVADMPVSGEAKRKKTMLRGILDATVSMPDGRLFRLVGIHLKSRLSRDGSAEDTRRREAYALRDYLNEALASQDGMPLLLYGDFNDGPSDSAVQVIQGPAKTEYRLNRLKPRDSRGETWTIYYEDGDTYHSFDHLFLNNTLKKLPWASLTLPPRSRPATTAACGWN